MRKTNKILITIILLSSLLLSIGYSAINNITLDIKGKAVAIPTTRILINGEDFNKTLKNSISTNSVNTTITKIVFDYWVNGYSENGVVVFKESDWGKGTPIDVDGLGGIKLFKSDDGTKAYILSETQIYANINCKDMFYYMKGVAEIVFNNFDTSKVENMYRLFRHCEEIETLDISSFNTENVTNMYDMFGSCTKLSNIKGLNTLKTSKVTDMSRMFWECTGLTSLDVSTFNTSNVIYMHQTFGGCTELTKIKLGSNFDTSKVKNMASMFYCDFKLTEIDVSFFDTSNVTKMNHMFGSCYELTKIKFGSSFNTSKVTTMESMFMDAHKLTEIDLTHFDTSNVINMTEMFFDSTELKTIYVSNKWSTAKVTQSTDMFNYCNSLVGGAGTTYDSNNVDITYARIDGGPDSETPGYFTFKANN